MNAVAPPEGRYGRAPSTGGRRRVVAAIATLGVVGTAGVVWLGISTAQPDVSWKDVGYTVHGDASVDVAFDVIRADPATPVRCRVKALTSHYVEAGVVTVDVGPGDRRAERRHAAVATAQEAVTGVVDTCWLVDTPNG